LGCHGSSRRFEKDAVNPKADLLSLRNLTRFGSVGKSAVRIGNFPVIFIVLPGFSSFCPEEVLLLEKATLTPDTIPNKMQVLSRTA
jgi:hypothetical protein